MIHKSKMLYVNNIQKQKKMLFLKKILYYKMTKMFIFQELKVIEFFWREATPSLPLPNDCHNHLVTKKG